MEESDYLQFISHEDIVSPINVLSENFQIENIIKVIYEKEKIKLSNWKVKYGDFGYVTKLYYSIIYRTLQLNNSLESLNNCFKEHNNYEYNFIDAFDKVMQIYEEAKNHIYENIEYYLYSDIYKGKTLLEKLLEPDYRIGNLIFIELTNKMFEIQNNNYKELGEFEELYYWYVVCFEIMYNWASFGLMGYTKDYATKRFCKLFWSIDFSDIASIQELFGNNILLELDKFPENSSNYVKNIDIDYFPIWEDAIRFMDGKITNFEIKIEGIWLKPFQKIKRDKHNFYELQMPENLNIFNIAPENLFVSEINVKAYFLLSQLEFAYFYNYRIPKIANLSKFLGFNDIIILKNRLDLEMEKLIRKFSDLFFEKYDILRNIRINLKNYDEKSSNYIISILDNNSNIEGNLENVLKYFYEEDYDYKISDFNRIDFYRTSKVYIKQLNYKLIRNFHQEILNDDKKHYMFPKVPYEIIDEYHLVFRYLYKIVLREFLFNYFKSFEEENSLFELIDKIIIEYYSKLYTINESVLENDIEEDD